MEKIIENIENYFNNVLSKYFKYTNKIEYSMYNNNSIKFYIQSPDLGLYNVLSGPETRKKTEDVLLKGLQKHDATIVYVIIKVTSKNKFEVILGHKEGRFYDTAERIDYSELPELGVWANIASRLDYNELISFLNVNNKQLYKYFIDESFWKHMIMNKFGQLPDSEILRDMTYEDFYITLLEYDYGESISKFEEKDQSYRRWWDDMSSIFRDLTNHGRYGIIRYILKTRKFTNTMVLLIAADYIIDIFEREPNDTDITLLNDIFKIGDFPVIDIRHYILTIVSYYDDAYSNKKRELFEILKTLLNTKVNINKGEIIGIPSQTLISVLKSRIIDDNQSVSFQIFKLFESYIQRADPSFKLPMNDDELITFLNNY